MKCAILISGHIRSNPMLDNNERGKPIIEKLKEFISALFEKNIESDIFVVTNEINFEIATSIFPEIKNIYEENTKSFLSEVASLQSFTEKTDFQKHLSHYKENFEKSTKSLNEFFSSGEEKYDPKSNGVFQFQKLYASYLLMKDYEKKCGEEYSLILRIRPDLIINFLDYEDFFEKLQQISEGKTLMCCPDTFFFGCRRIMKELCKAIKNLGGYIELTKLNFRNFVSSKSEAKPYLNWAFTGEYQAVSCILEKTGMNVDRERLKFNIDCKIIR